ncbi:hypothetical protein HRbin15_01857 [bacterium HR15]|nr:hypothetical protein HRbin15_01857 [bacterium HR15]
MEGSLRLYRSIGTGSYLVHQVYYYLSHSLCVILAVMPLQLLFQGVLWIPLCPVKDSKAASSAEPMGYLTMIIVRS